MAPTQGLSAIAAKRKLTEPEIESLDLAISEIETEEKLKRRNNDLRGEQSFKEAARLRWERWESILALMRSQLRFPSSQEDFVAALMWMSEQGRREDLEILQEVEKKPPYSSVEIDRLFEIAEEKITDREFDPNHQLRQFFGITEAEFAQVVGGKEGSTVARGRAEDLRLIKESWEAMFYPADAPTWFRSPVPRFGGKSPMEMVTAGYSQRVLGILERLEAGVHN